MTDLHRDEQALETFIGRVLRGQPLLRAPAALEQRVLEELEHRALLPWWKQSFTKWPMAARAAFLMLCILGCIPLALAAVAWVPSALQKSAIAAELRPA